MTNPLPDLLDRLTRLHLANRRDNELNPAQFAALDYLARANRFSRMPSAVADYLATTRGTISQTLKALMRKGLVAENPAPDDKRARRYDLTDLGRAMLANRPGPPDLGLSPARVQSTETALRHLLEAMLLTRGLRSFGLCKTCRHHESKDGAPFCALLNLTLAPEEPGEICQDHAPA
jgi:DNA-binding MarR family transcriptional regulator